MKNHLLFFVSLFFSTILPIEAQTAGDRDFHQWAATPPMGWNSWDCYGADVTEQQVKANADYMAQHLKDAGWEYVVVDIRWFVENQTTGTSYNQTNPVYVMDEYGRYLPAVNRFPSAAGNQGFKPLADYIHNKGLKFGIHIMRGIPKKAVQEKLPVKGTAITADQIYSTNLQCTWLKDNYTILSDQPGAQEYYNSVFELYASWGVDFIKVDDLSRPYHQGEIELIRKAIDNTGRPIVLSMSPGETPTDKAEHAKNHANMWRMVDDFWDNWGQLTYQFDVCNKWAPFISSGAWPDADMLPLGHIDLKGSNSRRTKFTSNEQYTLMSLFTIFKSPLFFGGNLPDNDDFTNSLLTNEEVLYMHKNSVNNRQWYNNGETIAWTADDPHSNDKFLALFFPDDNGRISLRRSLYRSGQISRLTDNYGVNIELDLQDQTNELFLVVTDGGDNFNSDHADWIDPVIYNEKGDTLHLVDLNWESATIGWGNVHKNQSVSGNSLKIKDKTFSTGIGTHANSVIHYVIPEGYTGFKAFAGLDAGGTGQADGATVEFLIFDADPTLREVRPGQAIANSHKISRTLRREGVYLDADITGAQKLYLVVTDAGDNFNYDHADWINPVITKPDGTETKLTSLNWVNASSGWGSVQKNKSLDNHPLTVNGTVYDNGLGTNAYSYIEYDLPEGYTHFTSFCGFDDEVLNAPDGVSIEFMVFTGDPRVNNETKTIPVDMAALGFNGEVKVRDMWAKRDLGVFSENDFAPEIHYHGAGLYRLSPKTTSQNNNEPSTVSPVQVYPNPVQDYLTVNILKSNVKNVLFNIHSLDGRKLKSMPCTTSKTRINTGDLAKGIYIGIVDTGNTKDIIKFLKL
jgi:hypothetical protein